MYLYIRLHGMYGRNLTWVVVYLGTLTSTSHTYIHRDRQGAWAVLMKGERELRVQGG